MRQLLLACLRHVHHVVAVVAAGTHTEQLHQCARAYLCQTAQLLNARTPFMHCTGAVSRTLAAIQQCQQRPWHYPSCSCLSVLEAVPQYLSTLQCSGVDCCDRVALMRRADLLHLQTLCQAEAQQGCCCCGVIWVEGQCLLQGCVCLAMSTHSHAKAAIITPGLQRGASRQAGRQEVVSQQLLSAMHGLQH